MKTHPQELRKLHEQAQAILLKAGVSKVAEILKDDVAEMQLQGLLSFQRRISGLQKKRRGGWTVDRCGSESTISLTRFRFKS